MPPVSVDAIPLQRRFLETERWPPSVMRAYQFRLLSLLVEHARKTVPFYKARLDAAGIGDTNDLEHQWRKLPLLTRREVQGAGAALRSADVPKSFGQVSQTTTSGSTGMPVTVLGTAADTRFAKAIQLRGMLWHQFDFMKKFATVRKFKSVYARYPDGAISLRWDDIAAYPFVTGPVAALNINTSVADQAKWLARHRPDYLMTIPTNLAALVETCGEAVRPEKVVTFAETLRPEIRGLTRETWGAEIVDLYSAQEIGYIALQCPEREHYHVQSEHVLVEIIDDAGNECAPGEIGRVVVTPLRSFAMPLLRYVIGDYAEQGEPCSCGRSLPVLRRILGRTRNMLVAPDGRRFWPFFGATGFRRAAPIAQYQFIQTSLDEIEARLVVERALTAEEEDGLRARVLATLPCPFRISLSYVSEIPRAESGKFEDFVSQLDTESATALNRAE